MRKRFLLIQMFVLCLFAAGISVYEVGATPSTTYTKESIVATLETNGIVAHYRKGTGHLLTKKAESYILQIDYLDHYEVKNGWVEVYIFPDAADAYQESLVIKKHFDERVLQDMKLRKMAGKKMEKVSMPLFQHGNLILYAAGVSKNEEALDRITEAFSTFKY